MAKINILDKSTIDKIAAGEVIEKPFNVVKELIENSIDANADSITVEIKNGGISLIRVTDNGDGIEKSEIRKAFLSHATSKISKDKDLLSISSLGFRGEALATISAVSEVEVISKTNSDLLGFRYIIEGGDEISLDDIGAPSGTTFIVRNLFYNVPARRKFLKSEATEASYILDLMESIALSHPEISIKFINNGKVSFATSGSNNLKEVIYRIYGKEISDKVLDINIDTDCIKAFGYIGKPEINRSSRKFETFFINGRYINCDLFSKAVEDGLNNYLMQHKFPFCVIHFELNPSEIDVNVHPSKMEVRVHNYEEIYSIIASFVKTRMEEMELIPEAYIDNNIANEKPVISNKIPEPFENNRINNTKIDINSLSTIDFTKDDDSCNTLNTDQEFVIKKEENSVQLNLFEDKFLEKKSLPNYKILGQLFKTYWLIEFDEKLYFMDQHAAHEKVKYERLVNQMNNKSVVSQIVAPPIILDLSSKEMHMINEYIASFNALGFEIDDFGNNSIAIRSIPTDLYGCDELTLFKEILDELIENPLKGDFEIVRNKLASMACKSAVKGNMAMNEEAVIKLIDELLSLENPYHCPHGRPTLITMTKYEIEKKFKRIV